MWSAGGYGTVGYGTSEDGNTEAAAQDRTNGRWHSGDKAYVTSDRLQSPEIRRDVYDDSDH